MSEDEQDTSRRYWKAVISALATAEKRDAAWEFYLDKFAGGNAGDTLSGLILLLEANGIFLLTLPEKFQTELTQPVTEQLHSLREELQDNAERQRASLRATDVANESLDKANRLLENAKADLANKVSAAVRQIDIIALARQVLIQLEASMITPLSFALRDLPEQSRQIAAATKTAESSVQTWRKVHLGGIILNVSLIVLILGGVLFGFGWIRLQRHFKEKLAAEIAQISGNNTALTETALLNVPIRIMPWSDQDGKPVPGGYSLVIDNAEDAAIQPADGKKRGIIFFKAQRLIDKLDDLRGLVNDLQKSKAR